MRWFALETSSQQISLSFGEGMTCHREISRVGNASALIESIYREIAFDFSKIEHCVIGQGPGSYNGLRVGYAFLKGLLCLSPVPVTEIPTPLILATQAASELQVSQAAILVLNNARREEVYGALIQVREGIPHMD